jgi:hypothetical protein
MEFYKTLWLVIRDWLVVELAPATHPTYDKYGKWQLQM